jgi:alkaline phosphatase D
MRPQCNALVAGAAISFIIRVASFTLGVAMNLRQYFAAVLLALAPALAHADDTPLERIAFGSCAHQDRPQPIWESIVAAKPQLFLFTGDTIYADTRDPKVMKEKYDQFAALPGWQKLKKTCPVYATWDDHDYGENDAGAEYPKKVESQKLFLDFFEEPADSPRRKREGVYDAKVFGPADKSVQIILLDLRYFRGPLKKKAKTVAGEGPYVPSTDKTSTMLGEAQWKWLEEQLKVPAKIRLLVSSIQLVPEDHGYEKWMNLPHERERLYKLLKQSKVGGLIVLSGDRHLAELSLMDAGLGYPLYDLTSSGLNQGYQKWRKLEVNRHRVATMQYGNNFGVVTIDWKRKDPLIGLQIRDEEGDITIQQKVPLSVLQPGSLKPKANQMARLASGELLTPEEWPMHVDKKITIEMTVNSTGSNANLVFLNSCEQYNAEENFTVVLDKAGQESLKKAGIDAPKTHFAGKVIRVTGTLSVFRERPQIMVSDAGQIEVKKN